MTVLVIGATGTLGCQLMRECRLRGLFVLGAARSGSDYSVDIRDPLAVKRLFRKINPSTAINAAAND